MSGVVVGMMMHSNHSSANYSGDSGGGKALLVISIVVSVLIICGLCFLFHQEYWKTRATAEFSIIRSDGKIEKADKRVELRIGDVLRVELGITGREDRQVRVSMYAYDNAKGFWKLVRLPASTITYDFVFSTPGENNVNVQVMNETILPCERFYVNHFELPLTVID